MLVCLLFDFDMLDLFIYLKISQTLIQERNTKSQFSIIFYCSDSFFLHRVNVDESTVQTF